MREPEEQVYILTFFGAEGQIHECCLEPEDVDDFLEDEKQQLNGAVRRELWPVNVIQSRH